MGCLFHKGSQNANGTGKGTVKVKEYSWDKRDAVNLKDYTIENSEDGEVWKMPGSVNGQQFVIQNCKNTNIYIFDHVNTITVDDCINCKIIVSAVKGSISLRDCKECVCVVACGQFRTRDCRKMEIFLCCATQPIIEASSNIHFGCYQLFYNELEDHFQQAGLSVFNNNWSSIHDFTPIEGETNWCLFPDTISITDYVSLPATPDIQRLNASILEEKSIVPLTWGPHKTPKGESCLVTFFSDGQQIQRARAFINTMKTENPDCLLLLSKETEMQQMDAERVFRTNSYNRVVQRGSVIGLQYSGTNCIQSCQKVAVSIATATGSTGLVYAVVHELKVSRCFAEGCVFDILNVELGTCSTSENTEHAAFSKMLENLETMDNGLQAQTETSLNNQAGHESLKYCINLMYIIGLML